MAKDTRARFNTEVAKMRPDVRKAFLQAIDDITSMAQIEMVEAAIARGDVQRVMQVLHLGPEFFAPLDDAIRRSFLQGGAYQLSMLPKRHPATGGRLIVRFQGRHERAERWVTAASSKSIVQITEGQQELIREAIQAGLKAGHNPRKTALELVGRVDKISGSRKGGVIGLTSQEAGYVRNLRAALADPATASDYFHRKARDRRFDPLVRRSIKTGKRLSQADINRVTGRYSDRLLKVRGDRIARTETMTAMDAGRAEGMAQLIDRGEVSPDAVTGTWQSSGNANVRDTHANLDGQLVKFGEAFTSISGARMKHPRDSSLGAPASETVNCACYVGWKVDWLTGARGPTETPAPVPVKAERRSVGRGIAKIEAALIENKVAEKVSLKGVSKQGYEMLAVELDYLSRRFDAAPLHYIGPLSRLGYRPPRNANAAYFPTLSSKDGNFNGAFHVPTKFGNLKDRDTQNDYAVARSKEYAARQSFASQRRHLDPLAKVAIDKMPEGTYLYSTSTELRGADALRNTINHEFGHHIHFNSSAKTKINEFLAKERPIQTGWAEAISEYAALMKEEYIAEAFALFTRGAGHHYRIHPKLVAIFKEVDGDG